MGENKVQVDTLAKHHEMYGVSFIKQTGKHAHEDSIWESGLFGLNVFVTTAQKKKRLQEIGVTNRVGGAWRETHLSKHIFLITKSILS